MTTSRCAPSRYRPDIDGLRAVAVLAVVVFHAFPRALPGGFIGVDIFFVISGYLISGIILDGLDRGDFSFADFYARRIKRIFPALLLVLATSMAAGWFLLFADEYAHLGKHTAAGAGFVSNFALYTESGYFDAAAEVKPLLHLWSLSIEEQFYLLWPLALFFIRPRGVRSAVAMVVLILLASLAAGIWSLGADRAAAFYFSVLRFWELMVGGLLAFMVHYGPGHAIGAQAVIRLRQTAPNLHRLLAAPNVRAATGALMIAGALASFDKFTAFPGAHALLPTIGAFLIISAERAWLNRILASRVLVGIGLISYPLYLWHWPILAFLRIVESGVPSPPMLMAALGASFAMALLTYRLVEKPVRSSRAAAPAIYLLTAGVLIGGAGWAARANDGLADRWIERKGQFDIPLLGAERAGAIRFPRCHYPTETRHFADYLAEASPCFAIDTSRTNVLVLGDSHGADLYSALVSAYRHTNFLQATGSGCHPIEKAYVETPTHRCRALVRYIKHDFTGLQRLDGVILTARWNDNFRDVLEDIAYFQRRKLPVIVFGPTFEFSADVPKIIKRSRSFEHGVDMQKYAIQEVIRRDRAMQVFFEANGVPYVSKIGAICRAHTCPVLGAANELLILDYGHWTTAGARRAGEAFRKVPVLGGMGFLR